ncbi:MAG TPA: AMP-binding protein [Bacteroidia bacterium]|jgi:amino acid adenylation domain-containing protein|nr:AMP-binding protein [Bacteroidia bacterium]
MELFLRLQQAINTFSSRNAFCINATFYTYKDLATSISKIRKAIHSGTHEETEKIVGLVANDDLETYATIFALWFEGKAYVPISPDAPKDRNLSVIQQALLVTIIDSSEQPLFPEFNTIASKKLPDCEIDLVPKKVSDQELVYILFTSGTTGQPKGVPIDRGNLTGFMKSFEKMNFKMDENDKCLQMFEMTFDLSVVSYLFPLLYGACIYTIPKGKIKFNYIFELLDEEKLTFALMVPSILQYLRPYFEEMNFPDLKYSLFCGEALSLEITKEWSVCVPNAKILNYYGPTEDTIYCTYYVYNRTGENKTHNGVLSIGRAMEGTMTIAIDENNNILPAGENGQLCLGGIQLTPGYWNNEEKNKEAFFYIDYKGEHTRFYKTGDLCRFDKEGDILYLGRLDHQVKIQGFRIELAEIEFHVKSFLGKTNAVAVPILDAVGNTEIGLIIESKPMGTDPLLDHIKTKLPAYMIPKRIQFTDEFPLNTNGKTDRNKLKQLF